MAATSLAGLIVFTGCSASMSGTLDAPLLTPAGGTFSSSQAVTISEATPGTVLHCTTDGSAPTKSSPVCAQPVTVYKSETLSAVAVAADGTTSSAVTGTYTISLTAAATPVISPGTGLYTAAQTITIADATAGSTIYYTTDGSAPTSASPVYGGPLAVTASETISAVAISPATTISAVATATFTINYPTDTPVIAPIGGTYTSVQSVTITDATPGATIYYTLDGSAPTASSLVYGGPIVLSTSATTNISAVAIAPGNSVSAATSATFTLTLTASAPVIAPAGGTFTSAQAVTIADATPGAVIRYSTTGTATASSPIYTGAITVSTPGITTVSAIAVASGFANSPVANATFTLNLPTAPLPLFTPVAGTYTTVQTVSISDSAIGAAIYYTTDGSTPTTSSTQYEAPISVGVTETIKAIVTASGYSTSGVASSTYNINFPPAATPIISPAGGTFSSSQTVTITDSTSASTIYYTTNGTMPTTSSPIYSAPFSISASETVKAIAAASGFTTSPVASTVYTFVQPAAATPVIAPAGGTFNSAQTVTLSDATAGSSIRYTTDGSVPSTLSTLYTAPIAVSTSETIKAIASATGFNVSPVATAAFTITLQPTATPVISPAGGSFTSTQTVTLTDTTAGAVIHYTTDGSTPTASSTMYTAPFSVPSSKTVEAIASATGFTTSAVASATFTISAGIPLTGLVSTGSTPIPIVGAQVQLYSAGTTGYGSAPTALLATPVTTGSDGSFTLAYTCPAAPGDQLYLVATGGSVGGIANSNIALMTAIGSCVGLASGASFMVNDITTIASAYALSAFTLPASGGGINIGAPAPGTTCVSTGKETCNYMGLVNSFKTVNNLVNVSTGTARTITPFYATAPKPYINTSTVPQSRINTLAAIVASCTQQAVAGGCSSLFAAATPTGGSAPVDTLQTALSIAQNPGSNLAALYALLPTTEPYAPTLTDDAVNVGTCGGPPCDPPNDFALAITYTGGGLGLPPDNVHGSMLNTSMDIDPKGNILVTAYLGLSGNSGPIYSLSTGIIAEFNARGEAVTPAAVSYSSLGGVSLVAPPEDLYGPLSVAVDPSGSIWVDNFGSLNKLNSDLTFTGTSGASSNGQKIVGNLAIDESGDVWAADYQSLVEANSSGTLLSPSPNGWNGISVVAPSGYQQIEHLTFDSTGSLWTSDVSPSGFATSVYQIDTTNGTILQNFTSPDGTSSASIAPVVADAAGNVYTCPGGGSAIVNVYNAASGSIVSTFTQANGRACGNYAMAIDGQSHIFALNYSPTAGAEVLDEFTTQGVPISPSDGGYSAASPEEGATLNNRLVAGPIKIDGSGNIWAINSKTQNVNGAGNVLIEFVGLAAPSVSPLSLGLANSEIATRP